MTCWRRNSEAVIDRKVAPKTFLQGLKIKELGQQKYINRLQEVERVCKRHSNFWIGQYGQCKDSGNGKVVGFSPRINEE